MDLNEEEEEKGKKKKKEQTNEIGYSCCSGEGVSQPFLPRYFQIFQAPPHFNEMEQLQQLLRS